MANKLVAFIALLWCSLASAQEYPCTSLVTDTSYWTPCGATIQPTSIHGQAMKLLTPITIPANYRVQVVYYHRPQGCAGVVYVCPKREWCQ